jgi:glycosyltransferase involved in cell wall biosynthesis
MRICTIAARNHLPQARVLARSYTEVGGGARCSVLLLDDPGRTVSDAGEPFEILRPEQLGIGRYEVMAAMYDLSELAGTLKPRLLRYLIERDGQPLAYCDPDIRFYDDVGEIARLAAEEELVVTPRGPEVYDLGFIAISPGETAERLLGWWTERARSGGVVDGRWRGELSALVPRFHVLRDPGADVAYWNLHERRVERDGDRYTVNGQRLKFFHFSGFDPARPFALSRHQTRVRLPDEPVIAALCEQYATEVRRAGFDRDGHCPWAYRQLADGTPLTAGLRRLYGEGDRAGAFRLSPFTDAGAREFKDWCQSPGERGAAHGLSRLALAVHDGRSDLRAAFPDLDGDDGARFAVWIGKHRHQAADLGLPPEWLPAPAPGGEDEEGAPWGVNVAGYLRSELGVGEAARTVITALDARGVPVMPVHGAYVPSSRQGHAFAFMTPSAAPFPVNLICVNADELPAFLDDAGPRFSRGRYTIGFWWWEATTFPERSRGAFELVDEVWVGSEYVAAALAPVSPVPVVKVRIPVAMPAIAPVARDQLGLPEGYLFLFMFDFHSVIERKNPMAVVEAFRRAFEPGSGASLVIKCINRQSKLDDYDRLRFAAQGHPDVHIIDRYVSAQEKDAMVASCDCYVSLHRSEGFGLTPAEAMYLGKPVIATGYSGNLDYMTQENSYLVDYTLRPVGEGHFPYPPDGEWAEPDLEHAARLMREVADDPLAAARRGRQAALDIRRTYSPEAAGETMERRLAQVRAHLESGGAVRHAAVPPATTRLDALRALIAQDPVPLKEGGGPARRLAFRAGMRLVRPVVRHQRQVAERIASELGRLHEEQRTARHQTGAQIAVVLAELRRHERATEEADP